MIKIRLKAIVCTFKSFVQFGFPLSHFFGAYQCWYWELSKDKKRYNYTSKTHNEKFYMKNVTEKKYYRLK